MAIVVGQIESLKTLKEKLNSKGITEFNSIGEIDEFKKNYDFKFIQITKNIKRSLEYEIEDKRFELIKLQRNYDDLHSETSSKLNKKIISLKEKIKLVEEKRIRNSFKSILLFPQHIILKRKVLKLHNDFENIINIKIATSALHVSQATQELDYYLNHKKTIILERCELEHKKLSRTKKVIEGLYSLIAGAIGENLVAKELQKLSDKSVLINDFSIRFDPPIFNRKDNDRIYSIQLDHLLVTNSGIFVIETKNWSKLSINNFDLRSPIKQITRSSYALFVLLNSEATRNDISLENHHWGNKQIPIRNIIAMVNGKPKENFKYVKVKSLNELNSYIQYFEPVFSDAEVKSISNYLIMKNK